MMLSVDRLSQSFGGRHVLREVTFEVGIAETVAVIGPNGAGKSTLFNAITGAVKPDSGTVTFSGRDITGLAPHSVAAAGVRRTFQNGGLFKEMNVLENLLTGLHGQIGGGVFSSLLGLPAMRAKERQALEECYALLDRVGLQNIATKRAGDLSIGQQRIIEFLRTVAGKPKMLLLDEPAVGLSPAARLHLAAIVSEVCSKDGISVLLIEHMMDLVTELSHRVVVLAAGRVIAEGSAEAVKSHPAVLEAYLGYK
jgi:branched-chain amino acid transport system ATP-binding protein